MFVHPVTLKRHMRRTENRILAEKTVDFVRRLFSNPQKTAPSAPSAPKVPRPSVHDVQSKFNALLKNTIHNLPITRNKGLVGQTLEKLLGIPISSECLDCSDGEVKLFPLKKDSRTGEWRPKETISITMRGVHTPQPIPWDDSGLCKKINNVLFIAYFRDDSSVHFVDSFLMNRDSCPDAYVAFQHDYETITTYYRTHGVTQTPKDLRTDKDASTTINGTYIQGRTKGAGGKSKRTVAFHFLRFPFIQDIVLTGGMGLGLVKQTPVEIKNVIDAMIDTVIEKVIDNHHSNARLQ